MSLQIQIQKVSKKFNGNWIFKNVSVSLNPLDKLAVLGANGSGKSTLMQIVAGYVSPNTGNITYHFNNNRIDKEKMYQLLSIAAPSIELVEEFSLIENVELFRKLKPLQNKMNPQDLTHLCYLETSKNKPIQFLSSGMKQRFKLALAIVADVPFLLLDEPTSNLDAQGIEWYKKMIVDYATNKTCLICSNQINDEYFFCNKQLNIDNFNKD